MYVYEVYMKRIRNFCVYAFVIVLAFAPVAFAAGNAQIKAQMYSTIKNSPYFSTQKVFVDKFIQQLDTLGFNSDTAQWIAVDNYLVVDNKSFQQINNVYYMVYKSKDNAIIGLVRFKCKTPQNGGFKKIETYNYKSYNLRLDVDVNRFNLIEETACEI